MYNDAIGERGWARLMKESVYICAAATCLMGWVRTRIGTESLAPLEGREVFSSTDPSLVLLEYAQARDWLEDWNSPYPLLILWLHETDDPPPELLEHPRFHGCIKADDDIDAQRYVIKSALDRMQDERVASGKLQNILEVGRALASEKDLDSLLDLILEYAQKLLGADGASIYTRDKNGKLYFRLWKNASTQTKAEAQKTLVGDYSIAGYVARSGDTVVLDDAYNIPESAPYQFNPASDKSIGYHTRSMLTLPMKNKEGDVVGVLQLINRKRDPKASLSNKKDCDRLVIPFGKREIHMAQALAGQAGVALENSILYSDIENLFEGFIRASMQAFEARDPTTAGHSFRVAGFTEQLATAVDHTDDKLFRDVGFNKDEMRELRYAALLHDFGKVGVRENVLVKSHKLYPYEIETLKQRFQIARSSFERDALHRIINLYENGMGSGDHDAIVEQRTQIESLLREEGQRLDRFLELILHANEPAVSHTEVGNELQDVAGYTFRNETGEQVRLLDDFEFAGLALSKGSLNPDEREEIESHVSHTFAFLSLIPWTRNLSQLPHIAHGHHEKLDGSGYPLGLHADEIPIQTRMMTISDIYDALTATDRPYKRALPAERALDILKSEADAGKIDTGLLRIFVDSGAYKL
jgi:HD-GYP domain-containing protein (c-di-GMP phosphodiesterase class II)